MTDSGVSSYRLNLADPAAFEYVVRTYSEPLIRYAYSIAHSSAIAEDAMEDAFAALLVRGGRFGSMEQLRAWLYKTTRNKAVDYLRRHSREVPLSDVEQVLETADAQTDVLRREQREGVFRCMQQLPLQYREVVQLYYLDSFQIAEVCKVLGKTRKQVYNMLARAKIALKELLIQEGITYEEL